MGIGNDFVHQTQSLDLSHSAQNLGLDQPPNELPFDDTNLIQLPEPGSIEVPGLDLRDAIERRRSTRVWADEPMSIEELAYMLWCTQGLKSEFQFFGRAWHRNVPSSGGKHPFETFLTINKVTGLAKGLYRYIASRHALILIDDSPDVLERNVAAAGSINHFIKNSAVVLTWVAVPERMTWFATDRGYRNLYLDGGHVGQNAYLSAMQVGCSVCTMCMFEDELYNQLVGVDGEHQFVLYACAIGKVKPGPVHFPG